MKQRIIEQRRVLRRAITEKYEKWKSLLRENQNKEALLRSMTSTVMFSVIIRAIQFDEERLMKTTSCVHEKKFSSLLLAKSKKDELVSNPNDIIFNLSNYELTTEETRILRLGLKYGLAFRPKEPQIVATAESLWDQIERRNLIKKPSMKNRVKTALRAFTYSFLDTDSTRFHHDSKIVKTVKNLLNVHSLVILQPDKGLGCVLVNKADYFNKLDSIFYDTSKFQQIETDTSITQLRTLQAYLNKLASSDRKEITIDEKDYMRPMSAQPARAWGKPKVHKTFDLLPPFRPIIDTTNTVFSLVGKFLSKLLQPLTINSFTVKDSFDAASRIKNINLDLINVDGYKFISFDVTSLFTNVPLDLTVDIILKRVFTEKLISTTLSKSTLKKLILDCCRKTIFSYNGNYFKQIDGVAMGSNLGPVLSNIIMTELELRIVQPLIDSGIIKFYCRYVDDTLVLIKSKDIKHVHNLLNSFNSNIQFTVDTFENSNIHFLDLLILDNLDIDIYRKSTFTGQYLDYDSFIPWHYKISWIRALVHRAKTICSTNHIFTKQSNFIFDKLMAWNNFPARIRQSLKRRFLSDEPTKNDRTLDQKETLWLNLPYLGKEGEFLVNNLKKKLKKCLSDFNLKVIYKTNSISMFCSTKDKMSNLKKANLIYKFKCPGCLKCYIGKTERNLETRLLEHGKNKGKIDSTAIGDHLHSCIHYKDIISYFNILNNDIDLITHQCNTALNNTVVLDYNDNWLRLSFLESYYIKLHKPELNCGARASKELQLF